MSLLKHPPGIRMLAPPVVFAGHAFQVCAFLRCVEPIVVDAVQIEVRGSAIRRSPASRRLESVPFFHRVARMVTSRTELPVGEQQLPASFELPADVPNSYAGRQLSVEWSLRVHVDIPWWPDERLEYPLRVVSPASLGSEPRSSAVYVTSLMGPRDRRPYAEVSLGSPTVEAGEYLRGRVVLANGATQPDRPLRISLWAVEATGYPTNLWLGDRHLQHRWLVPVSSPQPDVPIEFAVQLPVNLVPGFRTLTLGLSWVLEVCVGTGSGVDATVWIPITVRPARTRGLAPFQAAEPQPVGSQRLRLVWSEAARETGWNHLDGELSREIADCRAVIRREHRDGGGMRGEVAFRDLDLGLRVDDHRLRCRDAGQARVLAEHTDALAAQHTLAEADDQRIVCTVDDAGTLVAAVAGLARHLEALMRAFVAAREQLPAPADMAEEVPWFRAAARRLGGDLDVASMDIWGMRDEIPFSLQAQWDDGGSRARTVLEARPTMPLDGRWHQRWGGHGEPGLLPDGLAELLVGADGVIVDAHAIQLVFPPWHGDLEPLVARLEGLLEVARRLSGQGLGFR